MDAEFDHPPPSENWLRDLFERAGLSPDAPLSEVEKKMDVLANAAAPIARGWVKWLVLIQGVTVAAPLFWLMRRTLGLSPAAVALGTLVATVIFVAALWWVRWRGAQRTWARARLVTEVVRGQLAAVLCPTSLKFHALDDIPSVQSLLLFRDPAQVQPWPDWKKAWSKIRVEDQLDYYVGARARAKRAKRQITQWTTALMDVMLALVVAGVVVTLSHRAPQWMRVFGDYRLEIALGALGAMLPLAIIFLQALRHLQELSHRTARFTRQIAMLEKAGQKLDQAATPEAALGIVEATEDQLLSEVVDWYFEAETAEQFFQIREKAPDAHAARALPASSLRRLRPIYWLLAIGGGGLLFLGRVAFWRMPWVIGASACTLGWLSYTTPSDPEARSRLRPEAALVDEVGQPWQPNPDRAEYGLVIIAHGLHDGVMLTAADGETRWMRTLSFDLQKRIGERAPNVGLVDWATAANPLNIHKIDPGITAAKFAGDVVAIKPQAHEVGDLLAFRLMQWIREKKIRRDRPLHLIGHSAGGFVVARAAIVLSQMNLAPEMMRVTILDTPGPDAEILQTLPSVCAVDFYMTSGFVIGLDESAPPQGIYLKRIPPVIRPVKELAVLQAHSYAHDWFIQTISTAKKGDDGFGKSPFCPASP